jgi:hypothetical protein
MAIKQKTTKKINFILNNFSFFLFFLFVFFYCLCFLFFYYSVSLLFNKLFIKAQAKLLKKKKQDNHKYSA